MKVTRSVYSCMFNLDMSTKKKFFGDQKNVFRGSYHHFDSLEFMLFQKNSNKCVFATIYNARSE